MTATENLDAPLLEVLADAVLPVLPPYEFSLYVLLLRRSRLAGSPSVRIGKRSISTALGKGTRSIGGNYQHITEKLRNLADAGFIEVGDTTREGTEYTVRLPGEVPQVRAVIDAADAHSEVAPDHFGDPALRRALFERDGWRCRYCGDPVSEGTATLDHIVPQHAGGSDDPDNLTTACLMCNSIKSGKTYEEAAPALLARVADRARSSSGD